MDTAITVLENVDSLEDFQPLIKRTHYVSGKIWKQHYEEGCPLRIIGFFKKTYQKMDELSGKMRSHHVLKTKDNDVVLNGYDHLDAQMKDVLVGQCVMVEFVGYGTPSRPQWHPPMRFLVSVNRKRSLDNEDLFRFVREIEAEEEEYRKNNPSE